MNSYKFTQDVKCEVWFRRYLAITAASEKEALEMIEKYRLEEINENDLEDNVKITGSEWLYDTSDGMVIPEMYNASIELQDASKNVIGDNAPMFVFNKFERVFNCTYKTDDHGWAIVKEHTVLWDADTEVVVILDEDGKEIKVKGAELYRLTDDGMRCPRCGRLLCKEHNKDVDYKYYCPECDENFC